MYLIACVVVEEHSDVWPWSRGEEESPLVD